MASSVCRGESAKYMVRPSGEKQVPLAQMTPPKSGVVERSGSTRQTEVTGRPFTVPVDPAIERVFVKTHGPADFDCGQPILDPPASSRQRRTREPEIIRGLLDREEASSWCHHFLPVVVSRGDSALGPPWPTHRHHEIRPRMVSRLRAPLP